MGSIACLARELGHVVSGTDQNIYPPMSHQLQDLGISLDQGYKTTSIPKKTDLVVIGNANISRGNPALEFVLENGVPFMSGAEWLYRSVLCDRWVVAVAGTHGKTTTTSMIAWILEEAGLEPGFLIGGLPKNFPASARVGKGPFFVIEADEYDTSYFDRRSKFLHYRPKTLVLNNLEFDHSDIFVDLEQIKEQFHLLLRTVPQHGLIIYPETDQNLQDVVSRGCWSEKQQIINETFSGDLNTQKDGIKISWGDKDPIEFTWSLMGDHNINNALSAIAAAQHVGVPVEFSCQALERFEGVKRRMEMIFENQNVIVYEDFAHHPTAIESTLRGLRELAPRDFILTVIEPASHTMRSGYHKETLSKSAQTADHVLWYKPESISWDMAILENEKAEIISDLKTLRKNILRRIEKEKEKIRVVIMSNSGFSGLCNDLVTALTNP